jgi:ClpP class serine protease
MGDFIHSLFLIGPLLKKIDGLKSIVGSIGVMLGGAGTCLLGAAGVAQEISASHGLAGLLEVVRQLPTDHNAQMLGLGWIAMKGGLAALGIAHKIDKLTAAAQAAAAPIANQETPK